MGTPSQPLTQTQAPDPIPMPASTVETKDTGTDCPPINTETSNNLKLQIEQEIEKALHDSTSKIILPTILKTKVSCPEQLGNLVTKISTTFDQIQETNNYGSYNLLM